MPRTERPPASIRLKLMATVTHPRPPLLRSWLQVLSTTNAPEGADDPVTRWLVITRSAVLPLTMTSGLVAALISIHRPGFDARWLALALVGILLAHVANNLMNDLFDEGVGLDTSKEYPRALYAPHPIVSGMTSRRGLAAAALLVNVIDLGIMLTLAAVRGWPVVAFAVGGFLLSVAYTAPPLRLKQHGLGEPDVFITWGPMMVCGVVYSATGHLDSRVLLASLPYALLCTTVLMGKHIDKIPWDREQRVHTIPVIIGERAARTVTLAMMVLFYVAVAGCVIASALPWATLLCVLAIPWCTKLFRAFIQPRPAAPPENFPVWPLWFAAVAFLHGRRAGALLIAGLIAGVILGF